MNKKIKFNDLNRSFKLIKNQYLENCFLNYFILFF